MFFQVKEEFRTKTETNTNTAVMGTLMYGADHVWAGRANFYLHNHEICQSLPNEVFIHMLDKIVAWQDRTSCLQLLLKPSRTTLSTFTKCDGSI